MSITTKRKAQDLVRKGKIQEAIEEMRQGVSEGDADPYDHVYLGDLLMRTEETDAGLQAYETAIQSYETVGLFRNAIAIGKKLLRVDSGRHEVHRTLGRLYDRDDLQGEAIPHYLCYLDSLSGETVPPQEFLEILERAASITGSKVEVALRLTDHFLRLKRGDRAAALLDSVADHCDRAGSEEIAADLRQRSRDAAVIVSDEATDESADGGADEVVDDGHVTIDLDTIDLNVGEEPAAELPPIPLVAASDPGSDQSSDEGSSSPASPLEFDTVDLTAGIEAALSAPPDEPTPSDGAQESESAPAADDNVYELDLGETGDFGEIDLAPTAADADGGDSGQVWEIEPESPADFGEIDLEPSAAEVPEVADLETVGFAEESAPAPADEADGGLSEESTLPVELDKSPEISLESADDDYLEGRWSDARFKYESILDSEPNQRRILSKLVETVRYLDDAQGEIHYLILLGDAWIAEEEYEEAMNCFLAVLKYDPENETAKRRLARFRDLGVQGAEQIDESTSNSVPSLLETGGTEVAVKDAGNAEFRSEDWVELEGLLEEFKAGLKEQMDESDYQAHYDLAVSHHSMGLLEEALDSIDQALACSEIPKIVQRQARELRGGCLLGLERNREAVHEYRETLEQAGDDAAARQTALHNLGRALESVEEWQEAYQTFAQLRAESPGYLDVEERMNRLQPRLPNQGNPEAA